MRGIVAALSCGRGAACVPCRRGLPLLLSIVWLLYPEFALAAQHSQRAVQLKQQADQIKKEGKKDDAVKLYKRATFFDPSYVEAHHAYQDLMSEMGKGAEAERYYRRLLKKQKDKAIWHYLVGRITSDLAEKEAEFRKSIKLDPSFAWGYYALGYFLENRGRRTEAIKEFHEALRVRPNWAAAWVGIGFTYMNENKNKEAISAFKKAIELNPREIDAYVDLGYVYRRIKQYEQVVAISKKGLELFPSNPWLCNNLGVAYYRLALYSQAVKRFKVALRQPDYDTPEIVYLNLALTYRRQRKLILATEACKEAIRIRPDFAYAHNCLAHIYYHRKKYDEAWKHVKKAQNLGWQVAPGFLEDLKRASGGG